MVYHNIVFNAEYSLLKPERSWPFPAFSGSTRLGDESCSPTDFPGLLGRQFSDKGPFRGSFKGFPQGFLTGVHGMLWALGLCSLACCVKGALLVFRPGGIWSAVLEAL